VGPDQVATLNPTLGVDRHGLYLIAQAADRAFKHALTPAYPRTSTTHSAVPVSTSTSGHPRLIPPRESGIGCWMWWLGQVGRS